MSGPLDVIGGTSAGGVFSGSTAPVSPGSGTLWYNTTTGSLNLWDGTTWISLAGGVGGATVSNTAPASPTNGMLWFDPSSIKMQVYYNGVWIATGGGSGGGSSSGPTAPTSPSNGQLWYDTGTRTLRAYVNGTWVLASGATAVTSSATAPTAPVAGELWFDTVAGAMKTFVGGAWVLAAGSASASGTVSPLNPVAGQLWYDTAAGTLKVFNGTAWVAADPAITPRGVAAGTDKGSVQATFNADAITVRLNEILIYTYGGSSYLYTGPVGAPVTAATAAQFTKLSSAVVIDSQFVALTGGADIGAAWTAYTPKPTVGGATMTIATYNNSTYILTNEAAPGTAASWTIVGPADIWTAIGVDTYRNSKVRIGSTAAPLAVLDIAGGTQTTDTPGIHLAQTWNAAAAVFNAIRVNITNTASAITSKLMDLKLGNVSVFNVSVNKRVGINVADAAGTLEIASGTITALEPVLKMSQTWNAPGVAEKAIQLDITNTASGISSELANFTYDGRSVLGVFAADAGTLLEVVDKTSRVQFEVTDQGISTALPPGTTITSPWKLGDVKTTTGATLSATQYVSVEIGGKIVKLAVVA